MDKQYNDIVSNEWIHVAVVEADRIALTHRLALLEGVADAAQMLIMNWQPGRVVDPKLITKLAHTLVELDKRDE